MKSCLHGILFRSEQGIIPGSEPQNYDDILKKLKFLLQCSATQPLILHTDASQYLTLSSKLPNC